MDLIGPIVAIVIGVILLVWAAHIVLTIIGWLFVVVGAVVLIRYLVGGRSRSDL